MDKLLEFLRYGSYACLILAIIMFIIAVILFFKFRIKDIIYELSGKAKTKLTTKMSDEYQNTGSLRASESHTADSHSKSEEINQSLIMTDRLQGKAKAQNNSQQENQENTMVLKNAGTGHLRKVSKKPNSVTSGNLNGFKIIKDVMVIHATERIQ